MDAYCIVNYCNDDDDDDDDDEDDNDDDDNDDDDDDEGDSHSMTLHKQEKAVSKFIAKYY